MTTKCKECGAQLENVPSGDFSTCPKGHGKLMPPIMPKPFDFLDVPASVVVCPECGGTVEVECMEWTLIDGVSRPTQAGLLVNCETWNPIDGDGHRYQQCDWIPVNMQVYKWLEAVQ